MIRAILVDDEKGSLSALAFELEAYCPEVEIVAQCQDPAEGIRQIKLLQPNLLFLDIEMPGINGFELLEQVRDINFHVIFVTAYDQFAIKAFDFNAIAYILKPIRKATLISAVQKVVDRNQPMMDYSGLEALVQNIRMQAGAGLEKIALPTHSGFTMVHINDITHLEGESNYTWVHLQHGKKHLVTRTLRDMEGMLAMPQYFRAHKSYLVNLNHVEQYVRGQGGYLVMKEGAQIPVARTQKSALMDLLHV